MSLINHKPEREPDLSTASLKRRSKKRAADMTSGDDTPSKRAKSSATSSRRWTADEYLELFETVSQRGAASKSCFEEAVAGRTRNQAYQAWRCVVHPLIKSALLAKQGGADDNVCALPKGVPKKAKGPVKAEDDE